MEEVVHLLCLLEFVSSDGHLGLFNVNSCERVQLYSQ